jgi:hypothetical protein
MKNPLDPKRKRTVSEKKYVPMTTSCMTEVKL